MFIEVVEMAVNVRSVWEKKNVRTILRAETLQHSCTFGGCRVSSVSHTGCLSPWTHIFMVNIANNMKIILVCKPHDFQNCRTFL